MTKPRKTCCSANNWARFDSRPTVSGLSRKLLYSKAPLSLSLSLSLLSRFPLPLSAGIISMNEIGMLSDSGCWNWNWCARWWFHFRWNRTPFLSFKECHSFPIASVRFWKLYGDALCLTSQKRISNEATHWEDVGFNLI